jgi:hypothetical protein
MNEDIESELLALDAAEEVKQPGWRYLAQGNLAHLVLEGSNAALCGVRANSWRDWRGDKEPAGVLARRNCAKCMRREVEME